MCANERDVFGKPGGAVVIIGSGVSPAIWPFVHRSLVVAYNQDMSERKRREFVFQFRALASEIPVEARLRHFLKAALKCYGLKCLSYFEVPADQVQGSEPPAAADAG